MRRREGEGGREEGIEREGGREGGRVGRREVTEKLLSVWACYMLVSIERELRRDTSEERREKLWAGRAGSASA